jgi:membrane fusion protein, multidrug efflux system
MSNVDRLDRFSPPSKPPTAPVREGVAADTGTSMSNVLPYSERSEAPARPNRPTVAPTPAPGKAVAPKAKERDSTRRRWTRLALFMLAPLALLVGACWYVTGGRIVSTDDAYVNAAKVGVSTDVSGIVAEVDVTDNQHVTAGQLLYRLDPRQFQIALNNAKANLAQTALTLNSMKVDYRRMLSDVAAQQAQVDLDRTNYNRYAMLIKSGTVSNSAYDQALYALQADQSRLTSLGQQAQVELAKLDGNPSAPTTSLPQYLEAQAQVDEARRELDHTIVRAAFAGTVTDVPAIAPGRYLTAATTAFYLVDTDHVWVDATPKETELTYVRPGQPVTVTVDTYPNLQWRGTVESISPAAAQEFALLPAENTSGNWVKVVQRVPMRVRIDTRDKQLPPLAAGMSVEVDVNTGHVRGLPHFFTSILGSLLARV